MPKKRFKAEQIVVLLRQIEVLMSQGKAAPVACREAGISQQSYYPWRKEYGGLISGKLRTTQSMPPRPTSIVPAMSPPCRGDISSSFTPRLSGNGAVLAIYRAETRQRRQY